MTTAALLMPHLTLQLTPRVHTYQSLALLLNLMSRVGHPFIRKGMFGGPNGAVSNVLGKMAGIREDLGFRNLGQASFWVDTERETSSAVKIGMEVDKKTGDHSSVAGSGRATRKADKHAM